MVILSIILFFAMLSLAFVLEGYHDYYIKENNSDAWHTYNLLFYIFFVGAFINILAFKITFEYWQVGILLIWIISSRILLMNSTINLLTGEKITYLSNKGVDKIAKKYVGNNLYFAINIVVYALGIYLLGL